MDTIAYLAAGVATADRNRARMRKTGTTPAGDPLWTEEEEAILRLHHPDYQAAIRALEGRRSYYSVRNRAQALGLAPKRSHWTGEQVMRLRRVYRHGSPAEIREAFPGRSLAYIQKMAAYFGIRRPRKPFAATGFLIIDQLRDKCFECALSMGDLDAMAGTGNYFRRAGWLSGTVKMSAVAKAAKALGGELMITWDDSPDDTPAAAAIPRRMPGGRADSTAAMRLAA